MNLHDITVEVGLVKLNAEGIFIDAINISADGIVIDDDAQIELFFLELPRWDHSMWLLFHVGPLGGPDIKIKMGSSEIHARVTSLSKGFNAYGYWSWILKAEFWKEEQREAWLKVLAEIREGVAKRDKERSESERLRICDQ